jgi:hypothetical protein
MDNGALQRIQEAKLKRLEELEVQAAMHGSTAPPHIITERDALRSELGFLDVALNPQLSSETKRALRRFDQLELVVNVVAGLVQRVSAMEQRDLANGKQRWVRQQVLNAWLAAISVGVLYLIFR